MGQYEWMALLGLVLAPLTLRKVSFQFRLIAVVGVGHFLAYSIVAYKTPWCLISFYWSLVLVAAYYLGLVYEESKKKK